MPIVPLVTIAEFDGRIAVAVGLFTRFFAAGT